ncbi:restriction endonuclease, partial [bacterium AH-315-K20]|nr:restriction endonuclease [bacterium AH-315-K20]
MNYPSIRIEGAILSPDILGQIEDLPGQRPADFGLDTGIKVKDEIARAWADAQDYWRIFQRKLETVKPGNNATTETRNLWIVPLLGLLRYDIEYQRSTELNGKTYAISHRITNRANASLQIIGYRDPAGLDKKPANATRRMSAHALVQEFLNLHEQLYGLVTDGHVIRLLRDSSRLIKQSYLEFDLDRIFTDGLFADFAILYRLLHATRLPLTNDVAAESLIERYHQDSLDSGARIREGLSSAVEQAIRDFGSGFLAHPPNEALRSAVSDGSLNPETYYKHLLRLIYRLLFLMVIEERDLVFPPETPRAKRDIYRHYYSLQRLRLLSEKRYLANRRRHDCWLALLSNFRLYEADGPGQKLGIAPLAGDLFGHDGIGPLADCTLDNAVLLGCLRSLSLYQHPDTRQLIRVNYAALNVEEFGSVYEGLLEYDPEFLIDGTRIEFGFKQGDKRAATGSHYTPDDLVQPLIKHSLDHLIADRLKADNPESALLDLRVADIACGSGHILLAAARRIATELAIVRTGEEQPSPSAYRTALRDVIRTCIYGVDLNPLAVELCKVALW